MRSWTSQARVRRPSGRRARPVRALCAVLAGLLGVAGIATASAAQLTIGAGSLASASGAHPCAGVATATATGVSGTTATGVRVTVPDGCAGHTVAVTVLSGTTTVASGSATVVTGATVVPVAAYTPATSLAVQAVVDGWSLPVTWSWTPPVTGPVSCRIPADTSVTCTATLAGGTQWGYPAITTFNRFVEVTTTSPTAVVWEVTFHLDDAAWPVRASRLTDTQGGLVLVSASACGTSPRTVTVRGTTSWGSYHQVRSGVTRSMQVEGSSIGGSGNLLSCP